ncbi:MAG: DUF1800 domain-containing protein [Acidobacteriota bacterium]|nr:DUF1800 domain-containing protein [Acidobacteriota bacterium]
MKRLALPLIALLLTTGASSDSKLSDHQRAVHVLNRLAFGPRPGDVDQVLKNGVDVWIDQQLHPDAIPDRAVEARLQNMPTLKLSNGTIMDTYYKPLVQARRARKAEAGEAPATTPEMMAARQKGREVVEDLVAQRIIRAAESDRQLNEVMVDFWFNHFNVFIGKGPDRFMITSYERDAIRPRIWGRFEDLLSATAKSPAMLFYLDNARSRAGALNENYAREIMELHTLGVDAGYTQKDVTELARVFTGWTIEQRSGTFVFRPRLHDSGEKTVLGVHFRAGGGIEEGQRMIHILAQHPATAHHIALQLCQRLVSDDPPKALVDRVAKKFLATDGDLRETERAIIDSPEFWDPKQYRAKVKSPFEYVISAVRAVNATVDNPLPIARALQQIGEPLYGAQPPTGYSDRADVWINTGALMNRLNFALALAANKLPGVHSDVVSIIPASEAADAAHSVDALAVALIGGDLSAPTRATIKSRIVERKAPTEDPRDNTQLPMIAGLILGSPEFQRQ